MGIRSWLRVGWGLVLLVSAWSLPFPNCESWAQRALEDKSAVPIDLRHLPRDPMFLMTGSPKALLQSQLGKAVHPKIAKELKALSNNLSYTLGLPLENLERITTVVVLDGGRESTLLSVAARQNLDRKQIFKRLLDSDEPREFQGQTLRVEGTQAVLMLSNRAFVFGPLDAIEGVIERALAGGDPGPRLRQAAGPHTGLVLLNPKALAGAFPPEEMPEELKTFLPLFRSSASQLRLEVDTRITVQLEMQFANEAEVQQSVKLLDKLRPKGRDMLKVVQKEAQAMKMSKSFIDLFRKNGEAILAARLEQTGSTLRATIELPVDSSDLAPVLIEALQKIDDSSTRLRSSNNMRQIVLALHNYHDAIGNFPASANFGPDGKPLLSWRVHILPYIEQNNLYREFKLSEPWDSPHNRKLLAKMPKVYEIKGKTPATPHSTFYQAIVGKGAAFEGKRGIRLIDFTDGTSNTVVIAEAGNAVPWTKPEDLPFELGKKLPALGGVYEQGFHVGMGDGSVRFLSRSIAAKRLEALFTRNGGEVIQD